MAKANPKSTPIIKSVKLSLPSSDEHAVHVKLGFDYGLEFVDEIISYRLMHGVLPAESYALEIRQIIGSSNKNCSLPEGFLAALVMVLCETSTHASVAAIRERRARGL